MLVCIPPALYSDTIAHGIGRIPGDKESLSAGGWALLSALPGFGIAFALGYLLSRAALIEKAATQPVHVPKRRQAISFSGLFLLSGIDTALSMLLATT